MAGPTYVISTDESVVDVFDGSAAVRISDDVESVATRVREDGAAAVVVDDRTIAGLPVVDRVRAADSAVPIVYAAPDATGQAAAAAIERGATEFVSTADGSAALVDRLRQLTAANGDPNGAQPEPSGDPRGLLERIHEVIAETDRPFEDRLRDVLAEARTALGVEFGALASVDDDRYEVDTIDGRDRLIAEGEEFPLAATYCERVVETGDSLAVTSIADERPDLTDRAVFDEYGMRCYLGAPVTVDDECWGTLCFFGRETPDERFTDRDRTVVEILAGWVGHELEHRQRRREVEASKRSLERTFERIDDAFFALDDEWNITYLNGRANDLIDAEGADLVGENVWEQFPEAVGIAFEEHYRRALDHQETVRFEEHFPSLGRWFEVRAYPSESGLSVYFDDVTDRKEVESRLRASERKFRGFAENLGEVVWMSSVSIDEIHYINPAYEEIWGRSRESLYEDPLSFLEGVHPEDRDRVRETIPDRAHGEYDEEYRVVRPDGSIRWVHDRGYPIEDDDGEVDRVVGIAEDVTERKLRERELHRYRRIVETIDDGVVIVDDDQRFAHVNEAYADIVGYDRDELLGVHASSFVDGDTWSEWFHVAMSMATGETDRATIEAELDGADGVVPVETRVTSLDFDGSDDFVCVVRDVTERREREAIVRRLLETTRALFSCDTAGEIASVVVGAAAEVFGYDFVGLRLYDEEADDLVLEAATDPILERYADRDRVGVDESPMGEAFATGNPIVIDDVREGSPYDYGALRGAMCIPLGDAGVLTVGSPLGDAFDDSDARLARLLATSAAAALEGVTRRETLVRYEQVLEAVEGMVYVLDDRGRFTLVTEPFAASLGYDRDELLGEHVSLVLDEVDVDRGQDQIGALLADPGRESATLEAICHTAAGGTFPVEIEIALLPFEERFRGTVGAVQDITERKERERYLQVLNRVLRHNLRNDLTVVIGYANLLTDAVDDDGLAATASELRDVATDLVELSEDAKRIEQVLRRGDVDATPIAIDALVERVIAREADRLAAATIDVDVPEGVAARADDELATALVELLDNAVEHSPGEDVRIRISATVREASAGDERDLVTLSVADDGHGIPRHEREIITGERDITQLAHGSGLGLWLVRWTVEAYGGRIAFEESELGGSRVDLTFDRAPVDRDARGAAITDATRATDGEGGDPIDPAGSDD